MCLYNDEKHKRLREVARRYRAKHPDTVKRANKNSRIRCANQIKQYQMRYAKEHPLAAVHGSMMKRCGHRAGKSEAERKYYEGRSIKVCEEWQSFPTFENWALKNGYRRGLQIDRIDTDKGYEPDNCRFVTPRENAINRRSTLLIEWEGKKVALIRLYEIMKPKIKYSTLYERVHRHGWSIKEALMKPAKGYK